MLAISTSSTSTHAHARPKTRVGVFEHRRAPRTRTRAAASRETRWGNSAGVRRSTSGLSQYLSPEPLLQSPTYAKMMAQLGQSTPTYAYALNNPLRYTDEDGLSPNHSMPGNLPSAPPDFCSLNPGSCPHTDPSGTNWDPSSFTPPGSSFCELNPGACPKPTNQCGGPGATSWASCVGACNFTGLAFYAACKAAGTVGCGKAAIQLIEHCVKACPPGPIQ